MITNRIVWTFVLLWNLTILVSKLKFDKFISLLCALPSMIQLSVVVCAITCLTHSGML